MYMDYRVSCMSVIATAVHYNDVYGLKSVQTKKSMQNTYTLVFITTTASKVGTRPNAPDQVLELSPLQDCQGNGETVVHPPTDT
jgi:hypothetical protein